MEIFLELVKLAGFVYLFWAVFHISRAVETILKKLLKREELEEHEKKYCSTFYPNTIGSTTSVPKCKFCDKEEWEH